MISISYNYSSLDFEFLEAAVSQAALFTDDIHFTHVNRFFNGAPEDQELLAKSRQVLQGRASFHELQYDPTFRESRVGGHLGFRFWHNLCRINNTINAKYPFVLFLDGDEVLDGAAMKNWLASIELGSRAAYVLNVYFYFRSQKFQATTWEEGPVMADKRLLKQEDLMSDHERWGLVKAPFERNVRSTAGVPMIHHYSWAKGSGDEECKASLLQKVSSWGHAGDRDWKALIEEEFSRPFSGKDFVHGYSYNILS
jgi:hypothetical protein